MQERQELDCGRVSSVRTGAYVVLVSLSVGAGFQAFLASLVPTPTQVAATTKHKDSVRAVLDARFGTYRFFQSGSFSHGTGVRYYSDVDYFASLKTTKPQSSDCLLYTSDAADE